MRIKIIGENNCARAARHLLQLAGFAVTEFLSSDAVATGPLAGYAITIDLAPALHTPDCLDRAPRNAADDEGQTLQRPDPPAHHPHAPAKEEAPSPQSASGCARDASSPSFVPLHDASARASAQGPSRTGFSLSGCVRNDAGENRQAEACPTDTVANGGRIHFDSVESALEAAVLRHVTQLAAAPVILDRPGGVVHSDRELRIVAPNTGDARADEAAAVAIEFGVLRGLLDLTAAPAATAKANSRSERAKKWWPFGILLIAGALGLLRPSRASVAARFSQDSAGIRGLNRTPLARAALATVAPEFVPADPQGQFATGEGFKITDGTNFLAVDPCAAQPKSYASINQTANAQLVAGTASKKIYVCSIHVVAAAASNVAVVEGTGTVCAAGTAGLSGFGGATAATGWNFAANGGIALGNGDSSLGAEATGGDNLCVYTPGSSQISGGISYVVQ